MSLLLRNKAPFNPIKIFLNLVVNLDDGGGEWCPTVFPKSPIDAKLG